MLRTVFVSSTFQDLQTHRKAVWDVLGSFDVSVRGMEDFGARTETPLQTCLLELEQSDIYIGIIAFRQGSIEPTSGKSYTQLEYEKALELSKQIFIYLVDDENALVLFKDIEDGEPRERLAEFKRVLRLRHTVDTFTDATDLATKLRRDLQRDLTSKMELSTSLDEFADSSVKLSQFYLMPKSVAGNEIKLRLKVTGDAFPASRAVCKTFNFEFGATIGITVELVQPEGDELPDLPCLFVNSKHTKTLLPVKGGDIIDAYVRLHFASQAIEALRARYSTDVDFPNSAFKKEHIATLLGEPVYSRADSTLAMELSKPVESVQRSITKSADA